MKKIIWVLLASVCSLSAANAANSSIANSPVECQNGHALAKQYTVMLSKQMLMGDVCTYTYASTTVRGNAIVMFNKVQQGVTYSCTSTNAINYGKRLINANLIANKATAPCSYATNLSGFTTTVCNSSASCTTMLAAPNSSAIFLTD
tara:strand:+ start:103638 stop:104078 length:441 start_codon:yes stop_codon:yes gene_type:complete